MIFKQRPEGRYIERVYFRERETTNREGRIWRMLKNSKGADVAETERKRQNTETRSES